MKASDWYLIAIIIVVLLFSAREAYSHSWYPRDCCSDRDCDVIPFDGITEEKLGWRVRFVSKRLGEVDAFVPYKHEKVKPNEHDGQFHGCFRPGGFPGGFGQIPDKVMRQFICFWYPVNV